MTGMSLAPVAGAEQGSSAAQPAATRTIFVVSTLGVGGSEKKIVRVANELAGRGHGCTVAYLGGPHTLRDQIQHGVGVQHLERSGKFSVRALRRLVALLAAERPVTLFAVDLYSLLYVHLAIRLSGRPAPKLVALVNTTEFVRARDKLFMSLYSSLLDATDLVVFGCDRQRQSWVSRYGLRRAPTSVIYNGVDVQHFSPAAAEAARERVRAGLGIAADEFVVGTVGRLVPEKDQASLLEAFARDGRDGRAAKLVLAGDGPLKGALQSQAVSLGISDQVIFAGEVKDVRGALAAMDVFVLPSRFETFSNAALEAMAMGRPMLMSDTGGASEMLDQGSAGRLFSPGDVDSLSGELRSLRDDDGLRARLAASARRRAESTFSIGAMIAQYEALACGRLSGAEGSRSPGLGP